MGKFSLWGVWRGGGFPSSPLVHGGIVEPMGRANGGTSPRLTVQSRASEVARDFMLSEPRLKAAKTELCVSLPACAGHLIKLSSD
jgi:hypothetical protein